ncbi:MAG: sulfur carrier protein ThiS [Desulfuromonadia bacterium]
MTLTVNGEERDFDGGTLTRLLEQLGIDPRRVAVERNREIVPKMKYDEIHLADGDRIEIVHFVGGG